MKHPKRTHHSWIAGVVGAVMISILLHGGRTAAKPNDYTTWKDRGIMYEAPNGGSAYYPSVLYDRQGFGKEHSKYRMWYSNGDGGVFVVESSDGLEWGVPTPVNGLGDDAHHVQVVYDPDHFGQGDDGPSYKIWYWDTNADLYSINAIASAQSKDGINWTNDQPVTQDATMKLVTGGASGWNRGSYGPIGIFYQSGASNSGDDPWGYKYVMYYDGTDGGKESTGLAFSRDGILWHAYTGNPVLSGTPDAWDSDDAAFGTVYRDDNGYHFWYSGGTDPVHEGIGYAFSKDGKSWTKDSGNPIFHISDGVPYRNKRVYTPAMVDDGKGLLKMYYSAQAIGEESKKIGLTVLKRPAPVAKGKRGKLVVEAERSESESYALSQNVPNPFNPDTEIHFHLPEVSSVVVKIFNISGQEVRTLVDDLYNAGDYSIRWDGKDRSGTSVSTGMYLCYIRAGTFSQTIKMNLLR